LTDQTGAIQPDERRPIGPAQTCAILANEARTILANQTGPVVADQAAAIVPDQAAAVLADQGSDQLCVWLQQTDNVETAADISRARQRLAETEDARRARDRLN